MKKIQITKTGIMPGGEISTFNFVGETKVGYIKYNPNIGDRFYIYSIENIENEEWSTSIVTKIIDENNFETVYSKYNWKFI